MLLEVRHPVRIGRRLWTRSKVVFLARARMGSLPLGARAPITLPFKNSEHLFAEPRWLPDSWKGSCRFMSEVVMNSVHSFNEPRPGRVALSKMFMIL